MDSDKVLDGYDDVLCPDDLQKILHVGRSTIYKFLADGKIKSIRVGTQYRIPKIYLIDFIYPSTDLKGGEDEVY